MTENKPNPQDVALAKEYSRRLKDALGDNLISVTLFGSRARGDARDGSDFDFVITVRNIDELTRDIVTDINVDMMNSYDELFSGIVYDEQQWSHTSRFPFGWNVQKEGVTL